MQIGARFVFDAQIHALRPTVVGEAIPDGMTADGGLSLVATRIRGGDHLWWPIVDPSRGRRAGAVTEPSHSTHIARLDGATRRRDARLPPTTPLTQRW